MTIRVRWMEKEAKTEARMALLVDRLVEMNLTN